MFHDCRRPSPLRCPRCNGEMQEVIGGMWCVDCGLYERVARDEGRQRDYNVERG